MHRSREAGRFGEWAGNSPASARKSYALVRKMDYIDRGAEPQRVDSKFDAVLEIDAKSDAVPASTAK